MADRKISELPAADALAGTETVPGAQAGVTKKITASAIAALVFSPAEIGAALADNDVVALYDTSATAPRTGLLSRVWTYISGKHTEVAATFPTLRPSLLLDFANSRQVDPRVTFVRASTATYVDRKGVMQTAAANVPRIDFDPVTLECKGLLIEELRTNLVFPSATGETQTRTVTAVAHTLSFWGTGSVALSGVATGTLAGTGATNRVSLTFTPTAGSLTLTVTGSVTNMQVEAGSFATTLIPTTSAAVTRSADVATMTGANFSEWYRSDEGTFFASVPSMSGTIATTNYAVSAGNGSSTELIGLRFASLISQLIVIDGSVVQASPTSSAYSSGGFRMAATYDADSFSISANGAVPTTDTSGTVPTPDRLVIGIQDTLSGNFLNGHISRLAFWPARLTNAQLQALSS